MKTIAEATRELSVEQHALIDLIADATQGPEHVHDLAFVSELLTQLMAAHEQTSVGWAIVTAHKALLKMAQNEGVIDAAPRISHPPRRELLESRLATAQSNARALDGALIELRRQSDAEVYGLRLESQTLRKDIIRLEEAKRKLEEDLAKRDAEKTDAYNAGYTAGADDERSDVR